jgi:hypothetical protein
MSGKKSSKGERLPDFVPLIRETLKSAAYNQLSLGARALFTALSAKCVKNNGHVYLSLRDAGKALNHQNRNDLANWFRELVHYGFLVMTEAASLGVDGKGKAPHWRITDKPTRNAATGQWDTTKDFLRWDGVVFEPHVRPSRRWNARKEEALKKQNPGRHVRTAVDDTSVPVLGGTFVPPEEESGTDVTPISADRGGTDVTPISSLPSGSAEGAADDPTELGEIDLEDMGDDGDEPGMIQIEDVDGNLIWIPGQNDEQRETA